MAFARHNPRDAQGHAKAMKWEERLEHEAQWSLPAQYDRFSYYYQQYQITRNYNKTQNINRAIRDEADILRKKRLKNMRIAGPKDGIKGTLGDDNIGGDPWWYKKQLEKDGKVPIGPKTHFEHDAFITQMQQSSTYLNTLTNSQKEQYIPVHYPTSQLSKSTNYLDKSPLALLEQQYVDSHMMYVDLLGIQKDIDITPELKNNIVGGFRKEFQYLLHNPGAKQKDFSDVLTNFHKLGKPIDDSEANHYKLHQINDQQFTNDINQMDLNNQSLLRATKDKLNKLRGSVGIQQQIKAALELSQNAIQKSLNLQSNPEFYELSPDERAEYIEFIKEDLKFEQERLDRDIQLNIDEIQQLREYDRIQLLPQSHIPFLPLPRFAANDLDTLNSIPYIRNDSNAEFTQHPFLFDTKNIFNNCMPTAISYMQCIRQHQWASKLEDVPQCNKLSMNLFQCQQHETSAIQSNSTQTWGQMITNWLWGNNQGNVQPQQGIKGYLTSFDKDVKQPLQQQLQQQLQSIQPTKQQQNEYATTIRQNQYNYIDQSILNHKANYERAIEEENNGWLTSWSLPYLNDTMVNKSQQIPHSSPLTGQPISPSLLYHQTDLNEELKQISTLQQSGPQDEEQQAYFQSQQYHDDYEQLSPIDRRYHPYPTGPKSFTKSILFNSDHVYMNYRDPKDVVDMIDKDWEFIETTGQRSSRANENYQSRTKPDEYEFEYVSQQEKLEYLDQHTLQVENALEDKYDDLLRHAERNGATLHDRYADERIRPKPQSAWW